MFYVKFRTMKCLLYFLLIRMIYGIVTPTVSSKATTSTSSASSQELDCSDYINSSNATIQSKSTLARLHACFNDNPYDTTQPPLPPGTTPQYIQLFYDYSLIYLVSFKENRILFIGQLGIGWIDYYRMWDFTELPVVKIEIPLRDIWHPQFLFVSTIKRQSLKIFDPEDMAILWPDYVTVMRRHVLEGHCDMDLYRFPFDRQSCTVQFQLERYFFYYYDVVIKRQNYTYKFENFQNDEWQVISVISLPINITLQQLVVNADGSASNTIATAFANASTGFNVTITLQRYSQFYIVNILVPIMLLAVIGQSSFAIPEHADAKLLVPLTVMLGFMFVQGIVANELPPSSKTPSIASFTLSCVLISSINVMACAFCMWIALLQVPIPNVVQLVALDIVGFALFPSRWYEYLQSKC